VAWTNLDKAPHTATARDESFDTGTLDKGDDAEIVLEDPGTYAYYCRFHQFMNGTIEVG
jgi:plastocyanin